MDKTKFDEIVLAILWCNQHAAGSAWKGLPWDSTDRLFQEGLISDPKGKRKSVDLSEAGQTGSAAQTLRVWAVAGGQSSPARGIAWLSRNSLLYGARSG